MVIADDQPAFLKILEKVINSNKKLRLSFSTTKGSQAVDFILGNKPDLALLDVSMNDLSGIGIARELLDKSIKTKVIILTSIDDIEYLKGSSDSGVVGYILKEFLSEDLNQCISEVINGKKYTSELLKNILEGKQKKGYPLIESLKLLSLTETKILKMITENFTSPQIAEDLQLSLKSVQNYRQNIAIKFGLTSYKKLVAFTSANREIILNYFSGSLK